MGIIKDILEDNHILFEYNQKRLSATDLSFLCRRLLLLQAVR
ncbi:MAG: hypothetical protein ACK5LL_09095 [Suipraeoptans sp.]